MQAHMWYNLWASRLTGDLRDSAVRNRDRVADLMWDNQLADAQRLATEWDAAHPREPQSSALHPLPASSRMESDITSS